MRKFKSRPWRSGIAGIVAAFMVLVSSLMMVEPVLAQRESTTLNYPQSLESGLQTLLRVTGRGEADAGVWNRLAETYMDLADDLLTDEGKRQKAYQEGAKAAQRAFGLDDSNAHISYMPPISAARNGSRDSRTPP